MDSQQLPIQFKPLLQNTFETFVANDNLEAVAHLRAVCNGSDAIAELKQAYFLGASACGKSHLLQALCHCAKHHQKHVAYLPLRKVLQHGSEIVDGMEAMDIVCIDDIGVIAGDRQWEESIFNLINRIRSQQGYLLAAGVDSPNHSGFMLPDLSSRLVWGGVYHITPPSDANKAQAIKLRMQHKGDVVSEEVVAWLLAHYSRDMHDLMQAVETLNKASIAQGRRITIPLVRSVLLKQPQRQTKPLG